MKYQMMHFHIHIIQHISKLHFVFWNFTIYCIKITAILTDIEENMQKLHKSVVLTSVMKCNIYSKCKEVEKFNQTNEKKNPC